MKKLFGEFNMTWKFLILFSIIIGVVVGGLNEILFLRNTSFQDIAIVMDMWIILAIFVIVNCKSAKEAVAKCFTFFLISQPIIYLTEVIIQTVFYNANIMSLLKLYFINYYYGAGWLYWTLLTIPGAFIAYQIKKDNILSGIVLSVATCYLSCKGTYDLIETFTRHFPYHLLNGIICVIMAFSLIYIILKNKNAKRIALAITSLGVISAIVLYIHALTVPYRGSELIDFGNEIQIVEDKIEDENIVRIEISSSGDYVIVNSSNRVGTSNVELIDNIGNQYDYTITVTSREIIINKK